jgi:hypothetical protein
MDLFPDPGMETAVSALAGENSYQRDLSTGLGSCGVATPNNSMMLSKISMLIALFSLLNFTGNFSKRGCSTAIS